VPPPSPALRLCSSAAAAGSDKQIKLWRNYKCVHTYVGHTDVVRSLVHLPGVGFASGSNDTFASPCLLICSRSFAEIFACGRILGSV
jgi:WD40 repeat protein